MDSQSSFGITLKNQLKDLCSVENSKAHTYFRGSGNQIFCITAILWEILHSQGENEVHSIHVL